MSLQETFTNIFTANIKREGSEALLDWMTNRSDFFKAPASTKFHLSKDEGLVEHSLNVYFRLKALASVERKLVWSNETLAIVALLHDLCKTNTYQKQPRWRKDDNGRWETYQQYVDINWLPFGHGEKSVYIVNSYMKLTREEAMAIRWHMGFTLSDNTNKKELRAAFDRFPLALLVHTADMLAASIDENPALCDDSSTLYERAALEACLSPTSAFAGLSIDEYEEEEIDE